MINKIDEFPGSDLNRRFLRDKYPAIAGFQRVSARTGEGLDELRTVIADVARQVKSTDSSMPTRWAWVRDQLTCLPSPYIGHDRYQEVCREGGVVTGEQQAALLDYLHDLGALVLLHGTGLTLIVQPQWIVDAVYEVVQARSVRANGGMFHRAVLVEILDPQRYSPEAHSLILEVLTAYRYALPLSQGQYVVPSLLRDVQPELPEPEGKVVEYVAQCAFLPEYVVAEMLVELGDELEEGLIWKTGAVVYSSLFNSRAVVIADIDARRVDVTVWGDEVRAHLGLIRHRIAERARPLGQSEYRERVPLPGSGASVDYHELLGLADMDVERFPAGQIGEEFSVSKLLDGEERSRVGENHRQRFEPPTVNIRDASVSFGAGAHHQHFALSESVANLVSGLRASGEVELAEELEKAHEAEDRGRTRHLARRALQDGASIASIADAAANLLARL